MQKALCIAQIDRAAGQTRLRFTRMMPEILQDWACKAQSLGRKIDNQPNFNHLNPQRKEAVTSSDLDEKFSSNSR